MGRIQSNVGLITGIPITDTVDQLIQVAARPRDLLTSRNEGLQQQQLAINSLATRLVSLQFDLSKLNVAAPFQARQVTSQNEEVLTAVMTSGGDPPLGSFAIQPVQTASAQQLISQRFEALDEIQDAGTLSFGFGGFVNEGISLDELNSGTGVSRGAIKITDLAGNSTTIDLSLARTVDDVLRAINADSTINITAAAVGDAITLTDAVGGASTLTVQEVNGGSTAADLGLAGISTTASTATGTDVFTLHTGTKLSRLNDGNGVYLSAAGIDDLTFNLRDGSTGVGVDLAGAATVGDVLDAINNDAALAGKVTATLAADGNRLELTDSSVGAGTFSVADGAVGTAAADLGLTAAASGGTITGNRLVSGLRDTLLATLQGGQGLGTLGNLDVTDRAGGSATVDLSGAETLGDIIASINAAGTNIVAAINPAGSGIELADTVGGAGNLIVANNIDGLLTADTLGIAVDAQQDSIDSSSLNRQTLSEATLLSSLNGGRGITASDISITDSAGVTDSIDLNTAGSEATTIGDVLDAINASSVLGVTASINSTGDGILLTDTALGSSTLGVQDVNGTLAADLNLTRASEIVDIGGTDTQVIDGTQRFAIDLADTGGDPQSVLLASLNDGSGIGFSDIKITDSSGQALYFDLNGAYAGVTTVGQLIDALNLEASAQGVAVTASINASETGILLTDTASGTGDLVVEDLNGSAAAELKILSTETTTTTVDGVGLFASPASGQGALENLADRINELAAGVTASVLHDGQGFRLQLLVDETGSAHKILLEVGDSGLVFDEVSAAQDALLVVGGQQTPGSGVLVSSSTNDFSDVIPDVDLSIQTSSETNVEVTVAKSDTELVSLIEDFIESYNAIRSDLDDLTVFDETDFTTGLLFGTNEALRVDTELSRLLTDRYFGVGSFTSLEEIGLSVDDEGQLQLDKSQFQAAFADKPQDLQRFFTHENGVVAKFDAALEKLAGAENGLLTNRNDALQATIDSNLDRIERFNESLDRQREVLLLQFFQLEQVIAGLQASQTALDALQPLEPLVSISR